MMIGDSHDSHFSSFHTSHILMTPYRSRRSSPAIKFVIGIMGLIAVTAITYILFISTRPVTKTIKIVKVESQSSIPVHFNNLPMPAKKYFAPITHLHDPQVPFGDEDPSWHFEASPLYTYTVLPGYPPVFMAISEDKPKNSAVWQRYNMGDDSFRSILMSSMRENNKCQVIDVGANYGTFSLISAALGCQTIAIEPADNIVAMLQLSVRMNSLTDRIKVLRNAVLSETGLSVGGVEGNDILDGGMSHIVRNVDQGHGLKSITVTDAAIHFANNDDILVLLIDTEGCDLEALEGALPLLKQGRIQNILVKSGPNDWWMRCKGVDKPIDPIPLYETIISMGYEIRLLNPLNLGVGEVVKPINDVKKLSREELYGTDDLLPDPLKQVNMPSYIVIDDDLKKYQELSIENPMDDHGKSAGGAQTKLWFKKIK